MQFFTEKHHGPADELLDVDRLMKAAPDYYRDRFQAIADLRAIDDGSLHRGNEFRRVASLVNVPLANMISTVLDPGWMKDKRKFYAWLDRNRRYCTYDRRNQGRGTHRDDLKLPLSAFGFDLPGARLQQEPAIATEAASEALSPVAEPAPEPSQAPETEA